jgi:hypothetical protein
MQLVKGGTLPAKTSLTPICCVCGLIRDKHEDTLDPERWVTKRTYVKTHGVHLAECHFTHTYCTGCFTDLMQRVRPSTRAMGDSIFVTRLLAEGGQVAWLRRLTTKTT